MNRPSILDLDLVVVPREATDEMMEPANFGYSPDKFATLWDAMLSASPYPTAWDDVRKYVEGLENNWTDDDRARAWRESFDSMHQRAMAAEDRIAELENRLADAERVIEPFAALANKYDPLEDDDETFPWGLRDGDLTLGHLRAARAITDNMEKMDE